MCYVIEHEGKQFSTDGKVDVQETTEQHNKRTEQAEIEWLKTAPEKVFLYVNQDMTKITTWLGTELAFGSFGYRTSGGLFGYRSYKRSVTCRLFGTLYHGWYMESSGTYCILKKAKRQGKVSAQ